MLTVFQLRTKRKEAKAKGQTFDMEAEVSSLVHACHSHLSMLCCTVLASYHHLSIALSLYCVGRCHVCCFGVRVVQSFP